MMGRYVLTQSGELDKSINTRSEIIRRNLEDEGAEGAGTNQPRQSTGNYN